MNDEATTTYHEEIYQMTEGNNSDCLRPISEGARFLTRELGVSPQSAWHIDPFGHSAVTASLWSQIGFSGNVADIVYL
jgi:hypothetical protein